MEEARKKLKCSLASVMVLDEEEKELVIIASIGLPQNIVKRTREGIGEGIAGYVAKTGEPLFIEDIEQDVRFLRKSKKRYWTKSLISCPIKHNNFLFGVLNVNNKVDKSDFTQDDLKRIEALANAASIKFSFANLEDIKKKVNDFKTLVSFSRNIMASSYISQIVNYTHDALSKLLNPEIIAITIIPQKKIYLATSRRIEEAKLMEFLSHKFSLFAPSIPNLFNFTWEIKRLDAKPSRKSFKSLLSSSISLPIIINDYEFGLLSIARESPFLKENIKLFSTILNYLSIVFGKIALTEDLTDSLKKTKEELIHQERMAAVGKITEKIAHDLRNPLTIVLLSTMFAKKAVKDDKVLETLNKVERAGFIMEKLVEGISSFAKEIKIKKENVSITKTIEDSLFLVEDKLSNIEKTIDIAYDEPILADPKKLEEVFTNIIQNAIQSMEGKGILGIKVEKEGDFVRIDISDTGPGIAPEIKDKIFSTFFTTKPKGLGLGLSIVNEIVEKHSGRIELESELGKGSCFKIFLPIYSK